jgi:hypothetical protein
MRQDLLAHVSTKSLPTIIVRLLSSWNPVTDIVRFSVFSKGTFPEVSKPIALNIAPSTL